MENWDFCSFFCEFLLPASSASSLRSAPGGIAAAPEQPFLAAQALSPCDAQGIMHSLTCSRVCTLHPSWADFYIDSLLLFYIARSSGKLPQMKRLSWRTNSLVNWWNKVFLFCHDLLYFKILVQTIDKGCCSPFQGFATAPFFIAFFLHALPDTDKKNIKICLLKRRR